MAVCDTCKKEMASPRTLTCKEKWFIKTEINGDEANVTIKRASVYLDEQRHCHDCGIGYGGFHHPGCDWERCPFCGGQLISCACEFVVASRDDVLKLAEEIKNEIAGQQ